MSDVRLRYEVLRAADALADAAIDLSTTYAGTWPPCEKWTRLRDEINAYRAARDAAPTDEPDMTKHAAPEDWHDVRFREGWDCALAAVRLDAADRAGTTETHTEWRVRWADGAVHEWADEQSCRQFLDVHARSGPGFVESRQVTTTRVESPWTEDQR